MVYKVEFVQENEKHKNLLEFQIQTNYQFPARRPDLLLISKVDWLGLFYGISTLKGYLMPNLLYIYIYKVKLATVVEGDLKAPISIATTPRCRGGHYSFPWIAPLYPWYVPYIAEW